MTDAGTTPIAQWRVDVDDYVQVLEVCRERGQAVVGSLGGEAGSATTADGSRLRASARSPSGTSAAKGLPASCRPMPPVTTTTSRTSTGLRPATSRLRWVGDNSLLVGRADGGLVRLAV